MATFTLDVNESIKYTARLESLHRSAFPSAVRNTLNNAAFGVKKTLPEVAASKFTIRSKTFFRTFTKVNKAKGFNVNSMVAVAGIDAKRNPKLGRNLAAQETGSTVDARKLFAHDQARTSRSRNKKVRRVNYIDKLNIHNANRAYRANKGTKNSKFVAAVYSTVRSGKKHMLLSSGGKGMVYEIMGLSQNRNTKNINFKIKKLYNYKSNPKYKARPRKFMAKTANIVSRKLPDYYRQNAEFQFKKHLKK